MELSKIDLSAIAAIGHDYDHLGLLIDTGEHLKYVEVPAPIHAYEGLQELAEITQEHQEYDALEDNLAIVETVSEYLYPGSREYYEISQQVNFIEQEGNVYKYEKTVAVKIEESLSLVEPENSKSIVNQEAYLLAVNYQADSQCLTMEFDDGSVYQCEEISPDLWEDFKVKIA